MRLSSRVPVRPLLGFVAGLLMTILLVVSAGVVFVASGEASSDQPTYNYDFSLASTTPTIKARTATHVARAAPARLSWRPTSSRSRSRAAKAGRGIDDVAARAPVGRRGSPMEIRPGTNAPVEIAGRPYSGHALDRMQGRGIPPGAVEDTIATGGSVAGRGGAVIHYSTANHISVVVGRNGRVVTVGYGRFRR